MTHYRVAVIKIDDSIDMYEFLARYDENREVEPYIDVPRDEALAAAREKCAEAKERVEAGSTDRFDKMLAGHADDGDEKLLTWYAERWCEQERDEDGNLLTRYNPDSKYDYFGEIDELTFDEWLATGDAGDDESLRADWKKLSKCGDGFWKPEYYTDSYGDEETFVKWCKLPSAWAVVTPDGEWHEPGRIGWFASNDATAESRRQWADTFHERFVAPYKDTGARVAILDCHI